jgi:hypothetical protein
MLNKTFSGGLTLQGALNTLAYLLNERVSLGTARVLDGDIGITKELIQLACSKFKSGWSSGVLSFEETISEDVMMEIIAEHKRMTFCGMSEDQYNIAYILHTDKQRTEIHYIAPKIELSTGKMLNPYYVKRDFKKKDLFQDYINAKYDLSSPKQEKSRELVKTSKKKWASKKSTIQKEIDEAVLGLVNQGVVQSRDDIIDFLRENGFEINRIRKGAISVLHEDVKRKDGSLDPISLKGAIYGEDFTDWGSLEKSIAREDKEARRGVAELKAELDDRIQRQAKFNGERYKARKATENKAVNPSESLTVRDGVGLRVRESGREDESHINKHEEELLREAERGVIYERHRTIAERSRRESEERRAEIDRERTEALAGLERLADELHRQRSGETSITQDQPNLADSIAEHFSPDPTRSQEGDTARAVSYYAEIKELDVEVAEAVRLEGELEGFEDIYKDGISVLGDSIRGRIGKAVESIRHKIVGIGERIEEWLEEKVVKDARSRNAKKRAKASIPSVLDDDGLDQGASPVLK